ncbi:MAG: hypothetical protein JSW01_04270 [Candidatus Bathyarchaeota archaeon]|nr:MAG: hypothetical protein JSW01_04270 [Candidatus Bathyarchaeota archaeon]
MVSTSSIDGWTGSKKTSIVKSIEKRLLGAPPKPLKSRITEAITRLRLQSQKLGQSIGRMEGRDKLMFDKVVKAIVSKDKGRATLYANECAEIRKVAKLIIGSQLALERALVRLETVSDLGDILVSVAPAVGVIQGIKDTIRVVVPEVSLELDQIHGMLSETVVEAGQMYDRSYSLDATEEAEKILSEANAIAEQRVRERFPEFPQSSIPTPNEPILPSFGQDL